MSNFSPSPSKEGRKKRREKKDGREKESLSLSLSLSLFLSLAFSSPSRLPTDLFPLQAFPRRSGRSDGSAGEGVGGGRRGSEEGSDGRRIIVKMLQTGRRGAARRAAH